MNLNYRQQILAKFPEAVFNHPRGGYIAHPFTGENVYLEDAGITLYWIVKRLEMQYDYKQGSYNDFAKGMKLFMKLYHNEWIKLFNYRRTMFKNF